MSGRLIVRPATPADDVALAALAEEAFDHLPQGVAGRQALARDLDRASRHARAERFVVERDGRVVATLLLERAPTAWRIVDLDVAAAARRSGVGRTLAERVLADACVPVELDADPARPAARAFWTALGFTPTGTGTTLRRTARAF